MIYNVKGAVVDLIDAANEDEAVAKLRARLVAAGFDPYDEIDPGFDAFESDDQPEPTTRTGWLKRVAEFYGLDDSSDGWGIYYGGRAPDRYLLVERNVRGSTPPYWFTTHNSFGAIRRYHLGQEYAEDWAVESVHDLDTGREVDFHVREVDVDV